MPLKIGSRRGAVIHIVAAAIAVSTVTLVAIDRLPVLVFEVSTQPLSDDEVRATAIRLGLTPEAMAAAGLVAADATEVIDDLRAHLTTNIEALRTADSDARSTQSSHDETLARVKSMRGTAQDRLNLATLRITLATKHADQSSALASALTAAAADLTQSERDALARIRANARWRVPTEYLVRDVSESDWRAFRDALANDRICEDLGRTPHAGCQSLLTTWDAESDVVAAKAAIEAHATGVTTAWNDAIDAE